MRSLAPTRARTREGGLARLSPSEALQGHRGDGGAERPLIAS